MNKDRSNAPRGARVWAVTGLMLSAALVACGGTFGEEPQESGDKPGDVGTAPPPPPAPTPSTPATWTAAKAFTTMENPVSGPVVDAAGVVSFASRTLPSGTVANHVFQADNSWKINASLENLAPQFPPNATASRGDVFVAAVGVTEGTTPLWSVKAGVAGTGQPTSIVTLQPSTTGTQNSPQITIDADKGATVFWLRGTALVSMRRLPNGAWGPQASIASGGANTTFSVLSRADTSATLVFGLTPTTATQASVIAALAVDSHGMFDRIVPISDTVGSVDARNLRGGVFAEGTLAVWPVTLSDGGKCLAARLLANGTWGPQTCVNAGRELDGLSNFGVATGATGKAGVWWTTQNNTVRTAALNDAGVWAIQGVPSTTALPAAITTSPVTLLSCAGGERALLWSQADGTHYGARRSAAGTWSSPVELLAGITDRTTAFAQLRGDDACNFTYAWMTGTTNGYDVVTRTWKSGADGIDAAVVHATGVKMTRSIGTSLWSGLVGLAVQPAGPAVLVWRDDRDALIHWTSHQ